MADWLGEGLVRRDGGEPFARGWGRGHVANGSDSGLLWLVSGDRPLHSQWRLIQAEAALEPVQAEAALEPDERDRYGELDRRMTAISIRGRIGGRVGGLAR